mmetsp:Transcript_3997/g.10459  ORF Transcript_3997/g.10459 Transcript_3997/m.10459 type:complete len:235 (+) Transcript_3997:1438-2142(+)
MPGSGRWLLLRTTIGGGRNRCHQPRTDGGRRRRHEPRKRGRPDHGRRRMHPRRYGVHCPVFEWCDLHRHGRRANGRVESSADDQQQRRSQIYRLYRHRGCSPQARHNDRNQLRRSRQDDEPVGRPLNHRGRLLAAGSHLPSPGRQGRSPCAGWPHRGRNRSGPLGGTKPSRDTVRDCLRGEPHRDDAPPGDEEIRQATRPRSHQHRRPHPVQKRHGRIIRLRVGFTNPYAVYIS